MFSNFKMQNTHESNNRKEKVFLGSDKKFGYTFSIIFFLFSVSPLLLSLSSRLTLIILSLLFAAAACLEPARLNPFNRAWSKLGLFLGKIISPLVLFILFYCVFLPVGLLLRFFKKDILNLTINKSASTYWIDSTQFENTSMKDQF